MISPTFLSGSTTFRRKPFDRLTFGRRNGPNDETLTVIVSCLCRTNEFVGQMCVGQMFVGQMLVAQMFVSQMFASQMFVGQMFVGQMLVGQMFVKQKNLSAK